MKIYNETKTEILENPDLTLGYLTSDTFTKHIDYVAPVEEQGHYVTLREYPETGGKEVEWVVDVPEVKEVLEHDEREAIQLYIPYTEDEIKKMKAQRLHAELQSFLSDTDYAVIKCGELKLDLETEYPGLSEKRAQARAKINELESEFTELRAPKTDYPIIV